MSVNNNGSQSKKEEENLDNKIFNKDENHEPKTASIHDDWKIEICRKRMRKKGEKKIRKEKGKERQRKTGQNKKRKRLNLDTIQPILL